MPLYDVEAADYSKMLRMILSSESGALPGPGGDVQRRFLEQGGGNGREDVGGPPAVAPAEFAARTRATTASTVPGARMSSFRPRGVSSRERPAPVAGVTGSADDSLFLEALEHAGQRARMQPEDVRRARPRRFPACGPRRAAPRAAGR